MTADFFIVQLAGDPCKLELQSDKQRPIPVLYTLILSTF